MSKKKKKQPAKAESSQTAAASSVAAATLPIDEAFTRGNYAAVHRLASKTSDTAHAGALVDKVRIDKIQFLIGVVASVIVVLVAMTTLHTH